MKQKLEKNDCIYRNTSKGKQIEVIDRVTKEHAITKSGLRLQRRGIGYWFVIGEPIGFNIYTKEMYEKDKLNRFLKEFNYQKISDNTKKRIIELLQNEN